MSARGRLWLFTILMFLLVVGVERIVHFVKLSRSGAGNPWFVVVVFLVVALMAAIIIYKALSAKWSAELAQEVDPELDAAMDQARERLDGAGAPDPSKAPVYVILGSDGSAKTTLVERCGLDPDLIAGPGGAGDPPPPTEVLNVWYSMRRVLVEAGYPVQMEQGRWNRLIHHLQPARLGALFFRGRQAHRAAIVCVDCAHLTGYRDGGHEELAQELRERLNDLAGGLGIHLPVYVVFTRVDQVPHFDEFARSLGADDARRVLGATLRFHHGTRDPGTRLDRLRKDVGQALDEIIASLSRVRVTLLGREPEPGIRAQAFEFPREMGKLKGQIIDFFGEVFRPRQLQANPFLRGFYFTGIRAAEVESSFDAMPAQPQQQPEATRGATMVFMGKAAQHAAQQAPIRHSARVSEWTFLSRLFPDVLFADGNAEKITAGGTRTDALRRFLLTLFAMAALVLGIGSTVSFLNNRTLVRRADAAVAGRRDLTSASPLSSALPRLDSLRVLAIELRGYRQEGPPLRLRWWLYRGARLYESVLPAYRNAFRDVLGVPAELALTNRVNRLIISGAEEGAYDGVYRALRAHLLLTQRPSLWHDSLERDSAAAFLAEEMYARWEADRGGVDISSSAEAHFRFFTELLVAGEVDPADPRPDLINNARAYLAQSKGPDRAYTLTVQRAEAAGRPVDLADYSPGRSYSVPGAFTREGWGEMEAVLEGRSRFESEESWVTGDSQGTDIAATREDVRGRYESQYIRHWQSFLQTAASGAGIPSGSRALLRVFGIISEHTNVSDPVRAAFQPIHVVVPPGTADPYRAEANQPYAQALDGVITALSDLQNDPQNSSPAQLANQSLSTEAQSLTGGFSSQGEAALASRLAAQMIRAPASVADSRIRLGPQRTWNARAAAFCSQDFQPVARLYPFNASAAAEASPNDVDALFLPGQSALWNLRNEIVDGGLAEILGNDLRAVRGVTPQPDPGFLAFLNSATRLAEDGLYAGGDQGIRFRLQEFDLPAEAAWVEFRLGDKERRFERTTRVGELFTWDGTARAASLRVQLRGVEQDVVPQATGPWAVFRVFQGATWEADPSSSRRYRVSWLAPDGSGARIVATVLFADAAIPLFSRNVFSGLQCVSRMVGQ